MVCATLVTRWRSQALTDVKPVNKNVKPAMSVAMQQRQQAFISSSSTLILIQLWVHNFIDSYFHAMLMNLYSK